MKKVGALWKRVSKAGETFVTGLFEIDGSKTSFIGFSNKNPKSDKSPDYFLFESEPMESRPVPHKPKKMAAQPRQQEEDEGEEEDAPL